VNPITFAVQSGTYGAAIAGLQDALLLVIEHQFINAFSEPNLPTADATRALTGGLTQPIKPQRIQSTFVETLRQLTLQYRIQRELKSLS